MSGGGIATQWALHPGPPHSRLLRRSDCAAGRWVHLGLWVWELLCVCTPDGEAPASTDVTHNLTVSSEGRAVNMSQRGVRCHLAGQT